MDEYVALTDASYTVSGRGGSHRYHWGSRKRSGMTACGQGVMCTGPGGTWDFPENVADYMRCGAPGCRQRWAEFEARRDTAPGSTGGRAVDPRGHLGPANRGRVPHERQAAM